MTKTGFYSALILLSYICCSFAAYPSVIFHGIGDSCNYPGDLDFTKKISLLTGAYATCVAIGAD